MNLLNIKNSFRGLFLTLFEKPKPEPKPELKLKKHNYALAEALFLKLKVRYAIHGTSDFKGSNHMKYFSNKIRVGESVYTIHETHCPYQSKTFAIGTEKGGAPLWVVTSIPVAVGSHLYKDSIGTPSKQLSSDDDLYYAVASILIEEERDPFDFFPARKQKPMFDPEKNWELFQEGLPQEFLEAA